jgi:SPOR domain
MADNNFRSDRNRRDPLAHRSTDAPAREAVDDPLAELARLIGQSATMNDDRYSSPPRDYAAPAGNVDWAADDRYAEQSDVDQEAYDQRYEQRYDERYDERREPPRLADPHPPQPPALSARDRAYAPSPARQFSAPALTSQPHYRDDQEPEGRPQEPEGRPQEPEGRPQLPAFLPRAPDSRYQYDDQDQGGPDDQYALDDYEDDAPNGRRRGGFVVIAAVLGLAVLGTAGAFAYRAMFGGSVLPSLPPIIKADDGPNRIMPSAANAQGSASNQAGANSSGSGDQLVPRQETPVNVPQPANAVAPTAPRVVATIPIFPDQTPGPPTGQMPSATGLPMPNAPMLSGQAPNATESGVAVPPMLAVQNAPAPAVAVTGGADQRNAAQTAPKKIHTVPIRPDQAAPADATATAAPPPAAVVASRPPTQHIAKPASQADANAPLSIVPNQSGETPAAPARSPAAPARPTTLASAASAPAAAPGSVGGYAVQVSSQRSEAEAQTAFRALQTKFPDQLGGRQPLVHRADLGDKGIFYRALVGPFASMEQAAAMCSSLKAAGGTCIVQRD